MDIISTSFGIGVGFLIVLIYFLIQDMMQPREITITPPAIEHKTYCPECQSYDIKTIDLDGLPWFEGGEFYECNKCGRRFGR